MNKIYTKLQHFYITLFFLPQLYYQPDNYFSSKLEMSTIRKSASGKTQLSRLVSSDGRSSYSKQYISSQSQSSQESPKNKAEQIENKIKYGLLYGLQQIIMLFFFVSKILLAPMIYPLYWGFSFLIYMCKITKIFCTFFLEGIHGVLASFRKDCFNQKLHYAVLKQSGLYLKNLGISLQDAFTYQLYDYALRKFMTVSRLQEDLRVAEIQPWSHIGMQYMKKVQKIKQISFFHNDTDKIEKLKSKIENIQPIFTDYSSQAAKNPKDIFIMFNRSKDLESKYVDIIKILSYIRRNLNQNGYFVFGSAFKTDGQITVFEELATSFGFQISMKEDVSKNILHSQKILKKVYKDRKIAWAKNKLIELTSKILNGDHMLGKFLRESWATVQKVTGIKYKPSQYIIYVLELNI